MKPMFPLALILILTAYTLVAQESPPTPAPQEEKKQEKQPEPEDVMKEMEELRKVRDSRPAEGTPVKPLEEEPAVRDPKPAPIPDRPRPMQPLRDDPLERRAATSGYREGDLIRSRTGRLVRSDDGLTGWLLAFDADSTGSQDAPLLLMPCRELEKMERALNESGSDDTRFTVTGEVFLYHGRAWLLPRISRLAPNRGNLQP